MFWFTVLTTEEYNGLTQDGVPQYFDGGLRQQSGWHQLVFLPSVEEALCFSAYHMSEKHLACSMEINVVGFSPQEVNLSYNVGQRKVSTNLGAPQVCPEHNGEGQLTRHELGLQPNNEVRHVLLGQ